MKDYRQKIALIEEDFKKTKKELKDAEKQTAKFLKECGKYKINKVSIGKRPEKGWPFGGEGNVFTFNNERDSNGWPAIWGVVGNLGISAGCGNADQHNVDNENLMEGVYELKNGKWSRVD